MATLIKTDGTITEVVPKNGKHFSLKELQGFVGGYIEIVSLLDRFLETDKVIVCNEEGKLKKLPYNEKASDEWYKINPEMKGFDILVGDVLICDRKEIK